jgi:hypothetical protein
VTVSTFKDITANGDVYIKTDITYGTISVLFSSKVVIMQSAFRKYQNQDRIYAEQYYRLFLKSIQGEQVRTVILKPFSRQI